MVRFAQPTTLLEFQSCFHWWVARVRDLALIWPFGCCWKVRCFWGWAPRYWSMMYSWNCYWTVYGASIACYSSRRRVTGHCHRRSCWGRSAWRLTCSFVAATMAQRNSLMRQSNKQACYCMNGCSACYYLSKMTNVNLTERRWMSPLRAQGWTGQCCCSLSQPY